uniref:Adipokinetic hormone n=1 Tax=Tabanus atratus TaxID=7207 RepID=AKH_TABAT|nr:RecName: Full=Adipokinetic hormone; Short=AKH; AltName: Full=Dipteran corpora cardiaca factor I; Short=DCC I [Tabanus atratus]
QLTFTPGW